MRKVRVLIVEDSPTLRLLLETIVEADPRLEVAGSVASAEAMLARLEELAPDVISLDIRLPGMNGLDATIEVMRRRPTPIVVVAADVNARDGFIALNALRAGALSVLEKPEGGTAEAFAAMASRICTHFYRMSQVKVVRQTFRRGLSFGLDGEAAVAPEAVPVPAPAGGGPYRVLAVVSSTGGPSALVQLLGGLGADFPLPVLIVQHIGPKFVAGFADWLDAMTPLTVRVAEDGETPRSGTAYLAPADRHLLLDGERLRLTDGPVAEGHKPSGTLLLRSVAAHAGKAGIGVILTGMGGDGAAGLLEIHRAGGHTVAEDETTAVVYGMPAAAVKLGAVRALLPVNAIGPHLRQRAGCPGEGGKR